MSKFADRLTRILRNGSIGIENLTEELINSFGVGEFATPISNTYPNVLFVSVLADLPAPISGVINIPANTLVFFLNSLDLAGNRLSFAGAGSIWGTGIYSCLVQSTLGNNIALITCPSALEISNISFQANPAIITDVPKIFNLDSVSTPNTLLLFDKVSIRNTKKVGNIKDYANVILSRFSTANCNDGLEFDNIFSSVVLESCRFAGLITGTALKFNSTVNILKRIRIDNSVFDIGASATALNVSASATIPSNSYIVKFCFFIGATTPLLGVQPSDNKASFFENIGVQNSATVSEYYMLSNLLPTTITTPLTYVKLAGVTLSGLYVQRFTLTNNRAVYTGTLTKFFLVQATVTIVTGNNQTAYIRIAKNGTPIASSEQYATGSSVGRAENIKSQTILQLSTNDYIEVWATNSVAGNITATDLNVIITPVNI